MRPKSGTAGRATAPLDPLKAANAVVASPGQIQQARPHGAAKLATKVAPVKVAKKGVAPKTSPPEAISNKPCGIAALKVACKHGRVPGPTNILQVVADNSRKRNTQFKWGKYTASYEHGEGGSDLATSSLAINGAQGDGRKQLACVDGGACDSEWKNGATHAFPLPAPTSASGNKWTLDCPPDVLSICGRGCDDVIRAIRVENYPSEQYQVSLGREAVDLLPKDKLKEFLDILFSDSPVAVTQKIEGFAGTFTGNWGWKEDKDWKAYFNLEASLNSDPLLSWAGTIDLSMGKVALAGKVPAFIANWATEYLADVVLGATLEVKIASTGKYSARFYADGTDQIVGDASVTASGTFNVHISPHLGAMEVVGISGNATAEVGIKGHAPFKITRAGIFYQFDAKVDPVTLKLGLILRIGRLEYSRTKSWMVTDEKTLFDQEEWKRIFADDLENGGASGSW